MNHLFPEEQPGQSPLEREVQEDPRSKTPTDEQFTTYAHVARQWGYEGLQHILHTIYSEPEHPDIKEYLAEISTQEQKEVQEASAHGTQRLRQKLEEAPDARIIREMMIFFRTYPGGSVIDEPSFYAWLDMQAEFLEPSFPELAPPRAWLGSDHTTSDYAKTDKLLQCIDTDMQTRSTQYPPSSGVPPMPPTLSSPAYRPVK